MDMLLNEVHVLVVDDVNAIRANLKDLLKQFGFRHISSASDCAEATKILETEQVHLVLSDWHMPPGSGIDLLKQVRANPKTKDLPFILVTAENAKENVIAAIQSGVDDYLVKPITIEQVQTKVYGALLKKKVLNE